MAAMLLRALARLLVATVCGLAFGATVQMLCVALLSGSYSGTRDSVVYWATGQQLAHHANPYDPAAILHRERSANGFPADRSPLFMRNPPWNLPLTLPLGFASAWLGSLLWILFLMACMALAVRLLWLMHGRPGNHRDWLAYSFGPGLICLINGQISALILLGLVLFLRLHKKRPFLAGMALWLFGLKPHLFLPFGAVLLVWIVLSRSYRLLAGLAFAFLASCGLTYLVDPQAWTQYLHLVHSSGIDRDFIPCLSFYLRFIPVPHAFWLQYLPAALGCVWALRYYWPRRAVWDWTLHGSPLMLVSIMVAPYSWLFDQILIIPAVLQGAYVTRSRKLLIWAALLSAGAEIGMICNLWHPSAVYLWTLWSAPAWLAWYLMADQQGFVPRWLAAKGIGRFQPLHLACPPQSETSFQPIAPDTLTADGFALCTVEQQQVIGSVPAE